MPKSQSSRQRNTGWRKEMATEGGSSGGVNGGGGGGGGGGFRSRMEYYLYSGDKKHVFVGMAIIGAIFGVPWFFMNRGTKHRSHQDYLERADKARSERLSSSTSSSVK